MVDRQDIDLTQLGKTPAKSKEKAEKKPEKEKVSAPKKQTPKKQFKITDTIFKNSFIIWCKSIDPKLWVDQESILKQLQKYGRKNTFTSMIDLIQYYMDNKWKKDKKNFKDS